MSNTTVLPCPWLLDHMDMVNNVQLVAYVILCPIYFLIGITTRTACVITFFKQYKKEKAFVYQIFASVSDLLEVIGVTLCFTTLNTFSGFRLDYPEQPWIQDWFKGCYPLMWYAAHLSSPIDNAFMTSTLLMSLSMSADRVFALAKPFVYKTMKNGKHHFVIIGLSFFLGISTSLFDMWRFDVVEAGDRYKIVVNENYTGWDVSQGLAHLRNTLRIIATTALISCNVAIVVFYRRSVSNKVGVTANNEERAAKRKSTEKSLVILTVCQSIFLTADITVYNVYYSIVYAVPTFSKCGGKLMAPIADSTLQLGGILEFFALIIVSKKFREEFLKILPCCTTKVKNLYPPSNNSGQGQRRLSQAVGLGGSGDRRMSTDTRRHSIDARRLSSGDQRHPPFPVLDRTALHPNTQPSLTAIQA